VCCTNFTTAIFSAQHICRGRYMPSYVRLYVRPSVRLSHGDKFHPEILTGAWTLSVGVKQGWVWKNRDGFEASMVESKAKARAGGIWGNGQWFLRPRPRPRPRPAVFNGWAERSDYITKTKTIIFFMSWKDQSARQKNIFYVWMNNTTFNAITGLGLDGLPRLWGKKNVKIEFCNNNNNT